MGEVTAAGEGRKDQQWQQQDMAKTANAEMTARSLFFFTQKLNVPDFTSEH